jgi:hypothetical protein
MKRATTQAMCTDSNFKQRKDASAFSSIRNWTMLLLLALMIQTSFAANQILNLRSSDKSLIKAYINGQEMSGAANTLRIENLPAGRLFVQVYKVDVNYGYETLDNAFRGYVEVQPNTEVFATINQQYQVLNVDRIALLNVNPWNNYPPYTRNDLGRRNVCAIPAAYQTPVVCGPMAMDMRDFTALKQTIANASFESTKLNIFKQALAYNYFSTAQVTDLMSLFCFESYKLDVAKLAYPKTIDQQNYYLVNNNFSFSSSVNQLGNYIAMR